MNRFVTLLFLIGLVGHSAAEDNGSSRLNIAVSYCMDMSCERAAVV